MELGRSMVEMLGVLAIIGVLSIVGIQGYKKAMLKHQANELMNLAMKVYAEAIARATMQSDKKVETMTATEKNQFKLFLTASADADSTGAIGNMDIPKPSFMTHNYFNVYVNLIPSSYTTRYYANQPYHEIYFDGMNGDCDLCEALKSFTELPPSAASYRILPGSQQGTAFWGIYVYCYAGAASKGRQNTCFKTTDDH